MNMQESELNKHLVEAIITLLKGYKASMDDKRRKNDYKYLASQCIRQYASPADHYHVSDAAQQLWNQLTDKPIEGYFYRDVVPCNKISEPIKVTKYVGASRNGKDDTLNVNHQYNVR